MTKKKKSLRGGERGYVDGEWEGVTKTKKEQRHGQVHHTKKSRNVH